MHKLTAAVSLTLAGLLAAAEAQAHFNWINLGSYSIKTGQAATVNVASGHAYPLGGFLKAEDLESISLTDPAGQKAGLIAENQIELKSAEVLNSVGTYLVAAKRKVGFYSKTAEGGKRQSKEGLSNVILCSESNTGMKALLTVGGEPGPTVPPAEFGHPMEIIPLANPGALKAGDYFPVKVLLNGKPYKGRIFATHMGFSTDDDVFAYAASTNDEGEGRIRILQPGVWLLKAEHKEPYPDLKVCDVKSYTATLTMEVK
ncbi:DUF4198 domain-containing protein [Candidatus Electronema sp. TJ]|uniref:DUF4198 domain-containing protein n=1 Tax=Candidatus Electronema sp. TJ TaxID=3401573 RepID=UPI003AA96675